jgi:hypothetical protein
MRCSLLFGIIGVLDAVPKALFPGMDRTCGDLIARMDVNDVSREIEIAIYLEAQFSWETEKTT